MSTASNVIPFPYQSRLNDETNTGRQIDPKDSFRVIQNSELIKEIPTTRMSIDELYSVPEAITPELNLALRLLGNCLNDVDHALSAIRSGNQIVSDDAMQRVQALLPELFNARVLGDGFGAIINATLCSLENMHGVPFNEQQIQIIRQILERIRSEPFMNFSAAVEEIMKLENAGFVVEPVAFEYLADWLDE